MNIELACENAQTDYEWSSTAMHVLVILIALFVFGAIPFAPYTTTVISGIFGSFLSLAYVSLNERI